VSIHNILRGVALGALASSVAFALALSAGCVGKPARGEKAARTQVENVAAKYRPQEGPALPNLTADSPLADFVTYAILKNPKVEAAFYDWKQSVEEIVAARSLPDPMLNLGAEIEKSLMGLTPMIGADPMNNWPGPGKLPLQAEAALDMARQKRALFRAEMLSTALPVKEAYYQMWVLNERIRLTRETIAVVNDFERLALQRLQVGQVSQQDVLRAQIELDRLASDLASLEDAAKPLEARWASALGVRSGEPAVPVPAKFEVEHLDLSEEGLLETAYKTNPRLEAMQTEVDRAMALYELAQKANVPDWSWSVGANVKTSPITVMPSVGITLPIWRDKVKAEIAAADAATGAARARLSSEQLDVAVEFAENAYAWRDADRKVRLYEDKLISKAQASLDAASAGYTAGITGFLDLLDAERMLLEFKMNDAMAKGDREMALAELSLSVLGRWPEGAANPLEPGGPKAGP